MEFEYQISSNFNTLRPRDGLVLAEPDEAAAVIDPEYLGEDGQQGGEGQHQAREPGPQQGVHDLAVGAMQRVADGVVDGRVPVQGHEDQVHHRHGAEEEVHEDPKAARIGFERPNSAIRIGRQTANTVDIG